MPEENWLNDPNGPFYDAKFGLYHLFWQYNPWGAVWGNMSWGHAVSKDLVNWAHLPPAMYNDQPYDVDGVYTGSVTVVNGVPTAAYTCVGPNGQRQCLAWPSNLSDPYYTNWTKDPSNPVIPDLPPSCNGDFRDDTTAWFDPITQQWLMGVGSNLGNNASIILYQSSDFRSWSISNVLWSNPGAGMWECPDFFPLDGDGLGYYAAKHSSGGQDWYAIGTYDPVQRTFDPAVATDHLYDGGQFYASKTFRDPIGERQVLWGWISEQDSAGPSRGWQGMQSLPRQISYDSDLQLLDIAPLPELTALRTSIIGSLSNTVIQSYTPIPGCAAAGNQIEVDAYFLMPGGSDGIEFGVAVLASADATVQTRAGVALTAAVGPLNNTDLPGGDITDIAMDPTLSDAVNAANCSSLCDASNACASWTFVRNGTAPDPHYPDCRCSLKGNVPSVTPGRSCCISGVRGGLSSVINKTQTGGDGPQDVTSLSLTMKGDESVVRVRVFVDHSIVEAFVQGGRTRITSRVYPANPSLASGVAVYASGSGATLINATVYALDSIWVPLDQL